MDFEKFSKETVVQINKEIDKLLVEWRREAGAVSKNLLPLIDKFIDSCKGGKRIRGILVVLGYEIGKDHLRGEIIKIAASYEIFHSAILAHDDIIDKSLIRRGQPSLFQALGGDHRGTSLVITLADAGFFLATKVIAESSFADKEKSEALKWFSKTMLDTAMGQILDIDMDCNSNRIIEGGDVITIMKYKTAKYTVCGPLILGAILAGGEEKLIRIFGEFGENLGIAFQIQDDILDSEVDRAGGLESAKKEVGKYRNEAMKILPEITKDPKMSKILEQMVDYLVNRKK